MYSSESNWYRRGAEAAVATYKYSEVRRYRQKINADLHNCQGVGVDKPAKIAYTSIILTANRIRSDGKELRLTSAKGSENR